MNFRAVVRAESLFQAVWACIFASAGLLPQILEAATPPKHVIARLWSYSFSQSTLVEARYVVDLASATAALEARPPSDYRTLRVERKRADVEAFDRLEKRIQEAGATDLDDDLAVAIKKIEKAKSWGHSPGDQLLASPDGNRAVLSPDFGEPIVVDLRTLHTQRLVNRSDPLPIPMAWSPDSNLIAFAPSEAGTIVLYDIGRRAIQSTISSQGAWVIAMEWSPDMQELALINRVNRRLHKTPKGLLESFSGHPDYRNDLVLQLLVIASQERHSVQLKSNLTEQSSYDYWIEWQ